MIAEQYPTRCLADSPLRAPGDAYDYGFAMPTKAQPLNPKELFALIESLTGIPASATPNAVVIPLPAEAA